MNQHDYVKECLAFYEEAGFIPGAKWEGAHYPAPNGKGDTTIQMLHDHHQVQGLWQSKEYDQCCFYNGHAKRFLTEGPFVSGWFELWDIYDKYSSLHSSANGRKTAELGVGAHAPGMASKGGTKGGKTTAELGLGIHGRSPEQMTEDRSKGGAKLVKLGLGIHGRSGEQMTEDGRKGGKESIKITNSQRWQNTDPNHPPHVSTPAGLTHWQKARGIDTSMRVKLT
jgi:hypothetical protein